jgi:hypothetical protein
MIARALSGSMTSVLVSRHVTRAGAALMRQSALSPTLKVLGMWMMNIGQSFV